MTLAQYLKKYRYTQTAFAKKAGLDIPLVNRIVKGNYCPRTWGVIRRISKATGGRVSAAGVFPVDHSHKP